MSTSASTAPRSSLGECVVCGKESSTRCSSCAKGGVEWMYFCSTEHQKLIWNVHKHVCGGSFKWPMLTAKEKDEMIELSTKTFKGPEGGTSWLEGFGEAALSADAVSSEEIASGSVSELFKAVTMNLMEGGAACQANQGFLLVHRGTAFDVKSRLLFEGRKWTKFSNLHKLIASDPVGFLAWTQLNHLPVTSKCFEKSWYSDLHHKTMILVGVLTYFHASLEPTNQAALQTSLKLFAWTINQIKAYALNVIHPTNPKEAIHFVETYLPALFDAAGTMIGNLADVSQGLANLGKGDTLVAPGSVTKQGVDLKSE